MFVLISGALAFRSPILDAQKFFGDRVARVFLPLFFWTVAYFIWRKYILHEVLNPVIIWNDLFAGQPYYHLYFLFLIAGLYIFSPVLSPAVESASDKIAVQSCFTILAFAALALALGTWSPNVLTLFVPYLGYYFLGPFLAKVASPAPMRLVFLYGFASFLTAFFTSALVRYLGSVGGSALYFYKYFSPTTVIQCVALFIFINSIKIKFISSRRLYSLGELTLGIYLIHPMILESLRMLWASRFPFVLDPVIDIPVTATLTVAISAAAVLVLKKVPFLRTVV